MPEFTITITGKGPSGCERHAKPGDKLYGRCGKLTCPDCLAYDFALNLKQKGNVIVEAKIAHNPGTAVEVVDDLARNERTSGEF